MSKQRVTGSVNAKPKKATPPKAKPKAKTKTKTTADLWGKFFKESWNVDAPVKGHFKSFKVVNPTSLDCYLELPASREARAILEEVEAWDYGFFRGMKERIGVSIVEIPLQRFFGMRNLANWEMHSTGLVHAVFTTWRKVVYDKFITDCVENNRAFTFSALSAILTKFVEKLGGVEVSEDDDDETVIAPKTQPILQIQTSTGPVVGRYASHEMIHGFGGSYVTLRLQNYVLVNDQWHVKVYEHTISSYTGKMNLDSLAIKSVDNLAELVERGRDIAILTKDSSYMDLKTHTMSVPGWFGSMYPAPALGRFMVDHSGCLSLNPNFETHIKGYRASMIPHADFEESDYACISPYMWGFSLQSKAWGRVHYDNVVKPDFREDSFDNLVMDEEDKSLILSLVQYTNPKDRGDFITDKGGGCIFLFHGKPGLGKTLTAEAVAEVVQRPLYAISVGELGTNVSDLETALQRVLMVAQRWNAVLLLDEADIFLEERSAGDIHRNAMVGTFLRLLEYYNGIMVLTTNRVRNIDAAFYSRISYAKCFEDHTTTVRTEVINNLLRLNGIKLSDEDIATLAKYEVNGRQLKNSVRLAKYLASSKARSVSLTDITAILDKMRLFEKQVGSQPNDSEPSTPRGFVGLA